MFDEALRALLGLVFFSTGGLALYCVSHMKSLESDGVPAFSSGVYAILIPVGLLALLAGAVMFFHNAGLIGEHLAAYPS